MSTFPSLGKISADAHGGNLVPHESVQ